ncbi:hypothetical protein BDV10DRAFT_182279 [Aspergillus recurvatus]
MRGGKFHQKVILAGHDGSTIQRPVLPETEQEYKDVLRIFDHFVEDDPGAVTPPDIQTFKAFMEYISINIEGRMKSVPQWAQWIGGGVAFNPPSGSREVLLHQGMSRQQCNSISKRS